MATKTTSRKSTKTSARKAPTKPKAPARPKAKAKSRKAPAPKASAPGRPKLSKPAAAKGASPKVSTPSKADSNLVKEIEKLKGLVAKQEATIAKFKEKASRLPRNARSREQILADATFGKKDWRAEYQGFTLSVYSYEAKKDNFEVKEEEPLMEVMLALPRDTDVGGQGAMMRNSDMIAVHWQPMEQLDEEGQPLAYIGKPGYVTREELGAIWPE